MRDDEFVKDVTARCRTLKQTGLWDAEPRIRPTAWLQNFDPADRPVAAELLASFTFINQQNTERLFVAAYRSLFDGLPKGTYAPTREDLIQKVPNAAFVRIHGEKSNESDSGLIFQRAARQRLGVDETRILSADNGRIHAQRGGTIVFTDDFIGSGDQFLATWRDESGGTSFERIFFGNRFCAALVCPAITKDALTRLSSEAPNVAISAAHILDSSSSFRALTGSPNRKQSDLQAQIESLLDKYSTRLAPRETYIANSPTYRKFGYKNLGLLLAFAHSVPDATLPIFWARGSGTWTALIERT